MENKVERSSNFEILRIIAMFLIVMSHWGWAFGGVVFGNTFHHVFYTIFRAFGQLGVILFILISSYFLSKSKFKISSFLRVFFQTFFSVLLLFLIFGIIGHFNENAAGGGV